MGLVEIRPGRNIWIEKNGNGPQKTLTQVEPLLDAGCATVAFDYLGCGRSEKPNKYSAYAASELYADLQEVFQRYTKGYDRVVLIGHSYGCYLVNLLASEPEAGKRVAAVVLIGAGYPVPGYERLRWVFHLPLFILSWLQPWLTDQFIKMAFHPDTFHKNPALIKRERGWSNQNPPYMFRAFHLQALSLFRGAAEYDSWLQNIRAPVLAIAGDKDALTPMKLGRMVIKRVRKGSSCEIPLGGHQVHEEQPAATNKDIMGFLKDVLKQDFASGEY